MSQGYNRLFLSLFLFVKFVLPAEIDGISFSDLSYSPLTNLRYPHQGWMASFSFEIVDPINKDDYFTLSFPLIYRIKFDENESSTIISLNDGTDAFECYVTQQAAYLHNSTNMRCNAIVDISSLSDIAGSITFSFSFSSGGSVYEPELVAASELYSGTMNLALTEKMSAPITFDQVEFDNDIYTIGRTTTYDSLETYYLGMRCSNGYLLEGLQRVNYDKQNEGFDLDCSSVQAYVGDSFNNWSLPLNYKDSKAKISCSSNSLEIKVGSQNSGDLFWINALQTVSEGFNTIQHDVTMQYTCSDTIKSTTYSTQFETIVDYVIYQGKAYATATISRGTSVTTEAQTCSALANCSSSASGFSSLNSSSSEIPYSSSTISSSSPLSVPSTTPIISTATNTITCSKCHGNVTSRTSSFPSSYTSELSSSLNPIGSTASTTRLTTNSEFIGSTSSTEPQIIPSSSFTTSSHLSSLLTDTPSEATSSSLESLNISSSSDTLSHPSTIPSKSLSIVTTSTIITGKTSSLFEPSASSFASSTPSNIFSLPPKILSYSMVVSNSSVPSVVLTSDNSTFPATSTDKTSRCTSTEQNSNSLIQSIVKSYLTSTSPQTHSSIFITSQVPSSFKTIQSTSISSTQFITVCTKCVTTNETADLSESDEYPRTTSQNSYNTEIFSFIQTQPSSITIDETMVPTTTINPSSQIFSPGSTHEIISGTEISYSKSPNTDIKGSKTFSVETGFNFSDISVKTTIDTIQTTSNEEATKGSSLAFVTRLSLAHIPISSQESVSIYEGTGLSRKISFLPLFIVGLFSYLFI